MKTKTVLFHYSILNVGGAEMSLLRIMRKLADCGWSVELVVSTGGGALEASVDPRVKVTRLRNTVCGKRFLQEKVVWRKLCWAMVYFVPFIFSRVQWCTRAIGFRWKKIDVAVVSLHGLSPRFCCRYVRAKCRVQWIRNDLAACDADGKAMREMLRFKDQLDAFVCVSETVKTSLLEKMPEVRNRTYVIYNVLSVDEMLRRSCEEGDPYAEYGDRLKVVTVCRLSDQSKGLFRMLGAHRRLLDEGLDFLWFVVGDGPDKDRLSDEVRKAKMDRHFILLGKKSNPFPYYKYADVSATLSFYEGLCGAVNEAKVMGKPVVSTRFSGIEEQITDEVSGLIVENSEQGVFEGLRRILTDHALRERLANNLLPRAITDDNSKIAIFEEVLEKKGELNGKK